MTPELPTDRPAAPLPAAAGPVAPAAALAKTLGDYCGALAALDVERVLGFYRDDAVVIDLIEHRIFSGPEQRREWIEQWARGYRDLALVQREILPAGNHVAVKWTLTGETAGGDPICLRGVDIMVVDRQGRIRSQWGTFHRHQDGTAPADATGAC